MVGWLVHVNQVKTMQLTVNCARLSPIHPLPGAATMTHSEDSNSFTSLLVTQQFIHRTHLVAGSRAPRIALFMAMSFAYPA